MSADETRRAGRRTQAQRRNELLDGGGVARAVAAAWRLCLRAWPLCEGLADEGTLARHFSDALVDSTVPQAAVDAAEPLRTTSDYLAPEEHHFGTHDAREGELRAQMAQVLALAFPAALTAAVAGTLPEGELGRMAARGALAELVGRYRTAETAAERDLVKTMLTESPPDDWPAILGDGEWLVSAVQPDAMELLPEAMFVLYDDFAAAADAYLTEVRLQRDILGEHAPDDTGPIIAAAEAEVAALTGPVDELRCEFPGSWTVSLRRVPS